MLQSLCVHVHVNHQIKKRSTVRTPALDSSKQKKNSFEFLILYVRAHGTTLIYTAANICERKGLHYNIPSDWSSNIEKILWGRLCG